jgi:hypothetical protein
VRRRHGCQVGPVRVPDLRVVVVTAVDIQRAEALFVSGLDPAEQPSGAQVRDAVRVELVVGDCPARMAQLYGDHPEASAARMVWCRAQVAQAFAVVPA